MLAAAGATALLLHARPGRILVHVLPVGQDMNSATAIAVDGPDVADVVTLFLLAGAKIQ
ncbi:MAG: hypothetical protein ACHQCE_09175 [Streptosporangiales bacterium]